MESTVQEPTTLVYNSRLKAAIRSRYRTQYGFASAINVNPSVVSNVVTGKVNLDQATWGAWANALNVPVEDIIPGGRT